MPSKISTKKEYDEILDQVENMGCFRTVRFASNIIIEVFNSEEELNDSSKINQNIDKKDFLNLTSKTSNLNVRAFYNNKPVKINGKLELSLSEFKKILKNKIRKNFVKDCGDDRLQDKNPQKTLKTVALVFLFINIAILVLLLIIGLISLKKRKTNLSDLKNDEYTKIKNDDIKEES